MKIIETSPHITYNITRIQQEESLNLWSSIWILFSIVLGIPHLVITAASIHIVFGLPHVLVSCPTWWISIDLRGGFYWTWLKPLKQHCRIMCLIDDTLNFLMHWFFFSSFLVHSCFFFNIFFSTYMFFLDSPASCTMFIFNKFHFPISFISSTTLFWAYYHNSLLLLD